MTVDLDSIHCIGVVGAGQMGRGIAQIAAQSGLDVVVLDASDTLAEQAVDRIARALDRLVSKEKMTASERDAIVARIVQLHGGDIAFSTQPGRTVFRVLLPVAGARTTTGRTSRVSRPAVRLT